MAVSGVAAEVVLQYMDINSRLRFSACNPTFRQFEKSYPLHIKNLSLRKKGFQIDDTIYRLGIYRTYEACTYMAIDYNREGGVQYDTAIFDRYGINEPKKIYKGSLERDMRELEKAKKKLEKLRKVVKGNAERIKEKGELTKKIRIINEKVAISKSKFEEFILLKISGKKHNEQLMVNYTEPIQEAFKDLMDRIFGGRGHQIHVRHLEILGGFENPLKTVKMQVKHLDMEYFTKLRDFEDLFFTNSPPLETARCYLQGYEDHMLLANAKLLILKVGVVESVFMFDVKKFSNPRILFKCADCFRSAHAIAFCFKKMNKAAKRHYTFEVSAENHEWYRMVRRFADEDTKNHFDERGFAFPATFTIKTNAGADLKFSADQKDDSIVTIDLELTP
ncbi:hypothetical protein L3Y34_019769 [Caenorhabditis briggsae]|uniref:F-box domain-containing protein n=1 Tax=Caenorhabditis briggsae TaxID=6238 RepID=A0AAE9DPV4_CAEBR|nr:hypothetical protein L3Y34_019769 [Caenorhabditis briggsae]